MRIAHRTATMLTALMTLLLLTAPPAPAQSMDEIGETMEEMELESSTSMDEAYIPPTSGQVGLAGTGIAQLDQETIQKLQKRVNLNFKDEDLQNVVRIIAEDTGLNIVLSAKDVKGKITLKLNDVPVGTALEAILRTHNLSMIRERGGIVRVLPLSKVIGDSQVELRVIEIPINWVQASRVAAALQPFLTTEGQVQAYQETNLLIIQDTQVKIDELREIVSKMDRPEKQVQIEARLVEMSVSASRSQGIRWDLITRDDDSLPLSKIVQGYEDTDEDGDFWNYLARPSGTIQEGSARTLGEDYLFEVDSLEVYLPGSQTPAALWSITKDMHILGQDFDITAAIDLLEDRNMAKTLANPKVTTLNNVPARVNMVRRIPYLEVAQSSGGQNNQTYEYEDVGVELIVTPRVTEMIEGEHYVQMNIRPVQNIFISQEGTNRPTVDLRESETNVIVKDEETAMILGLRQQQFSETRTAVPWFNRAPVIGWFFKSKSYNNDKNDLVAFVTPHVIKNPELSDELKMRYDEIDENWDLPDYFFDDVKWDEPHDR
ncbi:secretin and TonB N-terminal domain-containing protein [Candidatus Sumerlaeota bacterium]|nr:secretin and TonB N-terminal domain-containing protein [Candidatus Sumerlaeota bacterium]